MTPFGVALELQRELVDTGRQAAETGVDIQDALARSVVDSIESQREAQQRILGVQYMTLRRTIRRTDEELPGSTTTDDLLRDFDGQLANLQADQDEAIDTLVDTLEVTSDAVEGLALGSLGTAEEQLEALEATLEQLEALEAETLDTTDNPDG